MDKQFILTHTFNEAGTLSLSADSRIEIIKKFIKWGITKVQLAKVCGISYGHLDDILHLRQPMTKKMYNKIYKGIDKLVSKYTDLLQDFGMENSSN